MERNWKTRSQDFWLHVSHAHMRAEYYRDLGRKLFWLLAISQLVVLGAVGITFATSFLDPSWSGVPWLTGTAAVATLILIAFDVRGARGKIENLAVEWADLATEYKDAWLRMNDRERIQDDEKKSLETRGKALLAKAHSLPSFRRSLSRALDRVEATSLHHLIENQ